MDTSREMRDAERQSRRDGKAVGFRERAKLYRADAAYKRSVFAKEAADRLDQLAADNDREADRLTS